MSKNIEATYKTQHHKGYGERAAAMDDFNESDHPRADNGQFGAGGGSGKEQMAAVEAEMMKHAKAANTARATGDKPTVRASQAAYEKARTEYDRLFNLEKLAKIKATRNPKSEREHKSMLNAMSKTKLLKG